MTTSDRIYAIVYSFTEMEEWPGRLFPESGIVEVRNDKLWRYRKNATPEIIKSFHLTYMGTPHVQLQQIMEELSPGHLTRKHKIPGRRNTTLLDLHSDKSVRYVLEQKMDRLIDRMLNILKKEKIPFVSVLDRDIDLEPYLLSFEEQYPEPCLHFTKTSIGLDYSMTLSLGQNVFQPANNNMQVLNNRPGWVIIDRSVYQLREINGKKIQPFVNREKIEVPARILEQYFRTFILDVMGKVEVQTQGFDVINQNPKGIPHIRFVDDFVFHRWVMELYFDYNGVRFIYGEKSKKRVFLEMENEIRVTQNFRNETEEDKIANWLMNLGLVSTSSKRFSLSSSNDKYGIFYWYTAHIDLFAEKGINVSNPEVSDHKVVLHQPDIAFSYQKEIDWFDIKMEIHVGQFTFPFIKLLAHIRDRVSEYIIDRENVFIIPEEWFTTYEMLAKFAQVSNGNLILKRSNFPILEELENEQIGVSPLIQDIQTVDYVPSSLLKAELRPYQLDGVKWLVNHFQQNLGSCLADDMGLGKTVQTLAFLLYLQETKEIELPTQATGQLSLFNDGHNDNKLASLKALVVVPASLMYNWEAEAARFTPHFRVAMFTGSSENLEDDFIHAHDIILITYQKLIREDEYLKNFQFDVIVLDESHYIKNRTSKTFKAILSLRCLHKISLSGTPVENSLADLWSQMQFINPGMLGHYSFFKEHFQIPIERNNDGAALEELQTLISPFLLRRRRQDVLDELPELSEHVYYCHMSDKQAEFYEKEKSAARNHLLGISENDPKFKFHVFRTLTRLRQLANHPRMVNDSYKGTSGKTIEIMEYLTTLKKSGHKVLLFSTFTRHLEILMQEFLKTGWKFASLSGEDSRQKRKEQIALFQSDPNTTMFLISMKAGGTGLNLTAADFVIILDPWWNPFVEKQAIARAHRMGQKNKVSVTRFISKDTIEEKIIHLQSRKRSVVDQVIDTDTIPSLGHDEIRELL